MDISRGEHWKGSTSSQWRCTGEEGGRVLTGREVGGGGAWGWEGGGQRAISALVEGGCNRRRRVTDNRDVGMRTDG